LIAKEAHIRKEDFLCIELEGEISKKDKKIFRRMNDKNLIPLNQRSKEEAKKIQSMGGKALKGIPKYKITTCKRCKLDCPLKEKGKEAHWKCKIPDLKRKILEIGWNPANLDKAIITHLFELQTEIKTTIDRKRLLDSLMEYRKITQPPAQELNINQKSITIKLEGIDMGINYETGSNTKAGKPKAEEVH
jgi:hypothetical protein